MALHILARRLRALRDARAQIGDDLPHAIVIGLKRGAGLVDAATRFCCMYQPFGNLDLRGEQILRVCLPLRVEHQRQGAAASEAAMEKKIHRKKIRQLEALHLSLTYIVEMVLDECGRQVLEHPRVHRLRSGDDPDVGGVPFVAGPRETSGQSEPVGTLTAYGPQTSDEPFNLLPLPLPLTLPSLPSTISLPDEPLRHRLARHQRRPECHDF